MLQSKLCQRACKANAEREIVLKSLPTLKKKHTDTQADTDGQNRKTIMKRMLNIDNGLQDLMKKHQAVTMCKNNSRESSKLKGCSPL